MNIVGKRSFPRDFIALTLVDKGTLSLEIDILLAYLLLRLCIIVIRIITLLKETRTEWIKS